MVFPIVNTKYIIYIRNKEVDTISVDIPSPIHSVSIYKDKLWILPMFGENIYKIDINGCILNKIKFSKEIIGISANDFIRIVASEEIIFLFPKYGKNIFVYQYKQNGIIKIIEEPTYFFGKMFIQSDTPYWDFIIEDKKLYLFPNQYRYKIINLLSLEESEYSFRYGDNINYDKYWKLIVDVYKNYIFQEDKKGEKKINEFFEFIHHLNRFDLLVNKEKIGKRIWESVR